jgi:hypothetical protein
MRIRRQGVQVVDSGKAALVLGRRRVCDGDPQSEAVSGARTRMSTASSNEG